jgi:hypothetical protein
VVFFAHRWPLCYGHYINDGILSLFSIPDWVWKLKPTIVTRYNLKELKRMLRIIGFGEYEVAYLEEKKYMYCENVYFARAIERSIGFGLTEFPLLREKYMNYYNTTKIKPTLHVFMNRNKGQRYIQNYKEIINCLNNITSIDWILFINDYKNPEENARNFASIKIMVCAGGSFIWNAFQMHPYTGIYILKGNYIDYCIAIVTYHLSIWMMAQTNPNIPQMGGEGGDANITTLKNNIFILMEAVEKKKWGPHGDAVPAFDIYKIKERVDNYIKDPTLLKLP